MRVKRTKVLTLFGLRSSLKGVLCFSINIGSILVGYIVKLEEDRMMQYVK